MPWLPDAESRRKPFLHGLRHRPPQCLPAVRRAVGPRGALLRRLRGEPCGRSSGAPGRRGPPRPLRPQGVGGEDPRYPRPDRGRAAPGHRRLLRSRGQHRHRRGDRRRGLPPAARRVPRGRERLRAPLRGADHTVRRRRLHGALRRADRPRRRRGPRLPRRSRHSGCAARRGGAVGRARGSPDRRADRYEHGPRPGRHDRQRPAPGVLGGGRHDQRRLAHHRLRGTRSDLPVGGDAQAGRGRLRDRGDRHRGLQGQARGDDRLPAAARHSPQRAASPGAARRTLPLRRACDRADLTRRALRRGAARNGPGGLRRR